MEPKFLSTSKNSPWFKALFDTSSDAIVVTNKDLSTLNSNSAFCNLVQLAKDEVDLMDFSTFLSEKSIQQINNFINRNTTNASVRSTSCTLKLVHASFEQEKAVHLHLLTDSQTSVDHLVVQIPNTDTTLQKLTLEALSQNTDDRVLIVDENRKIINYNQHLVEDLQKVNKDVQKGSSVNTVLLPTYEKKWIKLIDKALGGKNVTIEEQYEVENTQVFITAKFTALKDKHKVIACMITYAHITDLKKAKADLSQVNRDLTSYTMRLAEKNKFLRLVEKSLNTINLSDEEDIEELQKLQRQIDAELQKDDEWGSFKLYFINTHPGFFDTLSQRASELTQNELRHCAYVKMKLSNREVADLLHVQPRTVEIARYRIKKKLKLPAKTRLKTYINSIK